MNHIRTITSALAIIFVRPTSVLVALAVAALMFTLLILLPVGRLSIWAFYYQLTGLDAASLVSFGFFSFLVGTLVAMQVYLFHISRQKAAGRGVVSLIASFFGGIFGSAVCAVCLAVVFSLIGVPLTAVSFFLTHRIWALAVSSIIVLTSLYLSSKAIVAHRDGCSVCHV